MKVSNWIERYPRMLSTVTPEAELTAIAECMLSTPGQYEVYVVAADQRLLGRISRHRMANMLLVDFRPEHTRRQLIERITSGVAKDIMDPHFETARADDELEEVLHRQLDHEVEDMPVIDDDGRALGAINMTRILQIFLQDAERE